ncbi:hypothetical protein NE237_006059 [Protea cynaroides]|uniref:Uncharacterized protein n=1 Tax=Protea cynaroides TaxID=273540 RepID=A0A9Q0QV26_9MAGN|nr:hypothetical protein NE237_006059 [Protea cynaroides]
MNKDFDRWADVAEEEEDQDNEEGKLPLPSGEMHPKAPVAVTSMGLNSASIPSNSTLTPTSMESNVNVIHVPTSSEFTVPVVASSSVDEIGLQGNVVIQASPCSGHGTVFTCSQQVEIHYEDVTAVDKSLLMRKGLHLLARDPLDAHQGGGKKQLEDSNAHEARKTRVQTLRQKGQQ